MPAAIDPFSFGRAWMDQNCFEGRFFDPFAGVCGKMDQYLLSGSGRMKAKSCCVWGKNCLPDSFLQKMGPQQAMEQ